MKNTNFKKLVACLLVCCFTYALFTPLAEAKPHNNKPVKIEHQQKKHHKNKSCSDIVVDVLKCSRYDFDKARKHNMTLEDYILSCYISDQISGHDFEDIFKMNKNGKPYKEICKAYGIKWGHVRRHLNDKYEIMSEDAVRVGLVMWGLHEILR